MSSSRHHTHLSERRQHKSRSRSPRRERYHRSDRKDDEMQYRRKNEPDIKDRIGSSRRSMFDFTESGEQYTKKETKRPQKNQDEFLKMAEDLNYDENEDFGGFKRPTQYKSTNDQDKAQVKKEEPCFQQSGILAEFSNNVRGVVLKFTEPLDAAVPDKDQWAIYPFKGEESLGKSAYNALSSLFLEQIKLGPKSSVYLFGRDSRVADILLENPSCSMQHSVIQFREKHVTRTLSAEEQTARGLFQGYINEIEVRPYLMDLESTNKTFLNGSEIEAARYYELRDKDMLRFGESTREYVLMKK